MDKKKGKSKSRKSKKSMNKTDNFVAMGVEGAKNIKWKSFFILFLIVIITQCDVFVEKCLSNFSGTVYGSDPTAWGSVVIAIIVVILYATFDYMCECEYI